MSRRSKLRARAERERRENTAVMADVKKLARMSDAEARAYVAKQRQQEAKLARRPIPKSKGRPR